MKTFILDHTSAAELLAQHNAEAEARSNLIAFCKRNPGRWHSFTQDKATRRAVKALEREGFVEVNELDQFYFLVPTDA